jgi:hypothetical protein
LWLRNVLVIGTLLAGSGVFAALVILFGHLGWTVPKYVAAVIGLGYDLFAALAIIGYLLYLMDQEVRRGLR